jgi:hypothetical protein
MKIAVMQPYFLPYIGYFQLINAVNLFVLYDDVNYINRGWINRNQILNNGRKTQFTLPLSQASQNKKICNIKRLINPEWERKFFKTLEMSYKKAPYYQETRTLIEEIIASNETNISTFILHSLAVICRHLELTTEIIPSSNVYQNENLNAEDRIIDICKQSHAKEYFNPAGGKHLYNTSNFLENGINLHFIQTDLDLSYSQGLNNKPAKTQFISNLSILDVLMFNSINETQKLLQRCTIC